MLFYFVHYVHIRVLLYINYQSAIPAEISTAHPPHPQPPSNPSRNFSRALRGPGRVLEDEFQNKKTIMVKKGEHKKNLISPH